MRFAATVLACLGVGAASGALGDPPASPPATAPPATTPSSAPQTPAPAKPAVDLEEKRLIAQGYRAKMRHGEKVFCRTEPGLGSLLGGKESGGALGDVTAHRRQQRGE